MTNIATIKSPIQLGIRLKAADPLRLDALTRLAIREATARYLAGGSIATWEREMRAVLTRGHTAAALAGIAERLGVPLDSALLSERRLSRAERAEIRQAIAKQFGYLDAFVQAVQDGSLSPAQIAARAELYGGATRATYYGARWAEWELPFLPGDGATECKSNCRCASEVEDLGDGTGLYHYHLGATERHCTTCPERAAGSPYTVRRVEG